MSGGMMAKNSKSEARNPKQIRMLERREMQNKPDFVLGFEFENLI
jgi:hypothetical protein